MSILPRQLYAAWRVSGRSVSALQDAGPNEHLLQQVWLHQRLQRDRLKTLDGRSLIVLHPGFWNREPGPDFRRAVIQLGTDSPRSGDVEVDLAPGAWRGHGHEGNATYAGVILHVVWNAAPGSACTLPTLRLQPNLDAPLEELEDWLSSGAHLPAAVRGECAEPFCRLPEATRQELLHQAARVRLQCKAGELAARARQVGWEQALWEGLFAALGYKRNVWPMRRLAELLPRLKAGPGTTERLLLEARLLGTAGLLPADLVRPGTGTHLSRLWDVWWREREGLSDALLPREIWNLAGMRPANRPERRLALAAQWLSQPGFVTGLETWFQDEIADRRLRNALLERLATDQDPFWTRHWSFRSRRLAKPRPLLGLPRATDLAMNVILPWFWGRANAGGNDLLKERAEQRYFTWPAAEDNAVLRLARQRLLGAARPRPCSNAAGQQGLLQIVRDFCDRANALCEGCRFPGLIATLN